MLAAASSSSGRRLSASALTKAAGKAARASHPRHHEPNWRGSAASMSHSKQPMHWCGRARAHAAAEGVQTARSPGLFAESVHFGRSYFRNACPTSISGSQRPRPSSMHLTRTCGTAWHVGEATFPHKVSEPEVPGRTFNQVRGALDRLGPRAQHLVEDTARFGAFRAALAPVPPPCSTAPNGADSPHAANVHAALEAGHCFLW